MANGSDGFKISAHNTRHGGGHLELNQEAVSGVSSSDDTAQAATAEMAFEAFIGATYSRLVAAVFVIVYDRATAEDIVQETFAKAYLNWPKLWPDGSPAAWSYRVATNLSISWRRRLGRESRAIARMG
ncbi:MAG: RNA polymerase sigma factor, partial [Acidimicrobiia bacterium]